MPLTGTNKRCQQCINDCKQWSQNKVHWCRLFYSKQKFNAKKETEGTLTPTHLGINTP
jgi:hypothetical protein